LPIYTYRCESCGETFDKRQSFSDAALTTHETCGGDLRKVLHPAGIVFKGSGFYNTDYKNGKNGSAAKIDGGTPSETAAASTNGTSESKPESKGESTGSASTSTSTDAGSTGGAATAAKSEPAKSGSTG
jgi:putative FmdB family regulatory protein